MPHHGHSLAEDLERIRVLNRRRALGLMGVAGTSALLAGCGGGGSSSSSSSSGSTGTVTPTPTPSATATPTPTSTSSGSCTAYASETNGPYPADGTNTSSGPTSNVLPMTAFQRSDIRASILGSSTTVAAGVQTAITLTVVNVNASCAPLAGYAVYIWHCNALGQYSLYDQPAESYLRGIQVTDANGQVTFTTIFPGCYQGRYPHIHLEVFSSLATATTGRYATLVSQLAMPAAACSAVYADSRYGSSASRFAATSISSDGIFGDNTAAQNTAMTPSYSGSVSAGYTMAATIGLAL